MEALAFESDRLLDEVGWRILVELQRDGRISYSELGRRVSLTPPAVAERIRRMEDAGIIRGHRVDIDPEKVGLPITAIVRITARGEKACAELGRILAEKFPEVVECHRITGSESHVAKVLVRSVPDLQGVIDRLMPYGETITSIVLSSPVTHRIIEPNQP
jgi:Lrp/AsnC family leucine-responsive transcriptional regulator